VSFTEKFLLSGRARMDWNISPLYFRELRPLFTLASDSGDKEVWISQTGFRIIRRRRTSGDSLSGIRLEKVSKRARFPRHITRS
jgi:hypothetical protein